MTVIQLRDRLNHMLADFPDVGLYDVLVQQYDMTECESGVSSIEKHEDRVIIV